MCASAMTESELRLLAILFEPKDMIMGRCTLLFVEVQRLHDKPARVRKNCSNCHALPNYNAHPPHSLTLPHVIRFHSRFLLHRAPSLLPRFHPQSHPSLAFLLGHLHHFYAPSRWTGCSGISIASKRCLGEDQEGESESTCNTCFSNP